MRLALEAEKQEYVERADKEAGTASGTEAAAVREAQPVPDAVPEPPDLPAAWTLPLGPLLKAGDAVALAAEQKWGKEDSSPTAMPLNGIADSPVLTFTPERGLLRKQPRALALRGHGALCGQGGDRTRAARLHRQEPHVAQLEGRSRGVVARARDRRPRGRRGVAALAGRAVPGPRRGIRAENPHQGISRGESPDLRGRDVRRRAARRGDHDLEKRRQLPRPIRKRPSPRPGRLRLSGRQTVTRARGRRASATGGNPDLPERQALRGQFENGAFSGAGVMTWPSGDRYEGQFENGHRHGHGTYDYPDGSRYEGGWRKGKRHGTGIEIAAEGQRNRRRVGGREAVEAAAKEQQAEPKKTQTRYRGPEL